MPARRGFDGDENGVEAMRDERGRFVKGHSGGPGRPSRATERDYLAALSEAVGIDTWRDIVGRAVDDAKAGDGKARDWLAKYLIGDAKADSSNAVAEADDEAAIGQQRLELVGSYLLPLQLASDGYPVEEHARLAANKIISLLAERGERSVDTAAV